MDDQLAAFAEWLRGCAARAGYDPDTRGGLANLCREAGTDRGQTSRAFRGEVRPKIDSQRAWARVLGVPLGEMLVRSGTLQPGDLPDPGIKTPPATDDMDLYAVAAMYGIPEERAHLFVASVEAVANTFATDQKGSRISESQTGRKSAKR